MKGAAWADAAFTGRGIGKPSQGQKLGLYCAVLVALGMVIAMIGCLSQDKIGVEAGENRRLFGQALGVRPHG